MPRFAKADVNAALSTAAKAILTAGGPDGRVSRAEVNKALPALPKERRKLVDMFFRFIDNRDFKSGAQVTRADLTRAVGYAKKHMVAKYDLNSDGLSRDEISRMSLTGKLAVDLARELKKAGSVDLPTGPVSVTDRARGGPADRPRESVIMRRLCSLHQQAAHQHPASGTPGV